MKSAIFLSAALALFGWQQPRDAVGSRPAPTGTGQLSGVVTADDQAATPVRLATVTLTGAAVPLGRTVVTGDDGRFQFGNLPAGRYSIAAKKAAFITTYFGSRRPGGAGTPVTLAVGEHMTGLMLKVSKGAVITGTITEPSGAPAREIQVTAIRLGDPGLDPPASPFSAPVTDDRGAYRIHGLAPGEYLIAAAPSLPGSQDISARSVAEVDAVLQRLQQRSRAVVPVAAVAPASQVPDPTRAYVTLYYPGTPQSSEAQRLRVAAGEERTGVDFVLRLVPAVAIQGVVSAGGGAAPAVSMSISPLGQPATGRGGMLTFVTAPRLAQPPDEQGRFLYTSVPPGRYLLTARAMPSVSAAGRGAAGGGGGASGVVTFSSGAATPAAASSWAMAEVTSAGDNITGVVLALQPAMRFSGRLVFEPQSEIDLATVRVQLVRVDINYSSNFNGTVMGGLAPPVTMARPDGTFEIPGVLPGTYRVTTLVPGQAAWMLRSAIVNGRDALDVPLEFGQSGDVNGAVLTLSNQRAELAGRLASASGAPASDFVIVMFPADNALWRQTSRRIKSTRPATDGEFAIADVPAGEYLVAALIDLDPNELENPTFLQQLVPASVRVSIADGEKKRQELRVK